MNGQNQLEEGADFWIIPASGGVVTRCCIDYALSLELTTHGEQFTLRISGAFTFNSANTHEIRPEDPTTLGPVVVIIGKSVAKAIAYKDGALEIDFLTGERLFVRADPEYEAWEMTGDKGLLIVSKPGGNLSIWRSRG